jgi:4,5-dihydroxyphthalate decarboxylase
MMSKIKLTLACADYDRTRPLMDGVVAPEGVELTYLPLPQTEIFWRMLRHQEFDASEIGLVPYMLAVERGEPDLVGIPVYTSRSFRHSAIYVHDKSNIRRPEDLAGKRVGVSSYVNTAAVWVRGILRDEYGVERDQIRWMEGRGVKQTFQAPPGVVIEGVPPDRTLPEMLVTGELDALITPRMPEAFIAGGSSVRRLFPDFAAVEKDYYRRTRIFPIMHIVAMRGALARAHPWLPTSLYKAFCLAKTQCLKALYETTALKNSLPWMIAEVEEVRALFGGADYWTYGLDDAMNRTTLEVLCRYVHEQGITSRRIAPEELFDASVLDMERV